MSANLSHPPKCGRQRLWILTCTNSHNEYKTCIFSPITPPPRPSHPGISARHTGHLEGMSERDRWGVGVTDLASGALPIATTMFLRMVDLTAVKRHWPQHMCPHGVRVALVGGEKQMGHVYAERGSGTDGGSSWVRMGGVPEEIRSAFGVTTVGLRRSGRTVSLDDVAMGSSAGAGSGDTWGVLLATTSGGISHVEIWVKTLLGWSTSLPGSTRLRFCLRRSEPSVPSCAGDATRRRGGLWSGADVVRSIASGVALIVASDEEIVVILRNKRLWVSGGLAQHWDQSDTSTRAKSNTHTHRRPSWPLLCSSWVSFSSHVCGTGQGQISARQARRRRTRPRPLRCLPKAPLDIQGSLRISRFPHSFRYYSRFSPRVERPRGICLGLARLRVQRRCPVEELHERQRRHGREHALLMYVSQQTHLTLGIHPCAI